MHGYHGIGQQCSSCSELSTDTDPVNNLACKCHLQEDSHHSMVRLSVTGVHAAFSHRVIPEAGKYQPPFQRGATHAAVITHSLTPSQPSGSIDRSLQRPACLQHSNPSKPTPRDCSSQTFTYTLHGKLLVRSHLRSNLDANSPGTLS